MTEPTGIPEFLRQHSLTPEEQERLKALLGNLGADLPVEEAGHPADAREPAYLQGARDLALADVPDTQDPVGSLKALLGWSGLAAGNPVRPGAGPLSGGGSALGRGSNTTIWPIQAEAPPDSATDRPVFAPPAPGKSVAVAVGGSSGFFHLDPYEAGKAAVVEAARNLACTGAVPLGTVDRCPLEQPQDPERVWRWREWARGRAEGCRDCQAPFLGCSPSVPEQKAVGTSELMPTVAMLGLIEKPEPVPTPGFKKEGDAIILLGEVFDKADPLLGLGGSAYLECVQSRRKGVPPRCDPSREKELHLAIRGWIQSGVIQSAQACSGGGLGVALALSCLASPCAGEASQRLGAQIDLSAISRAEAGAASASSPLRLDALLFGEAQGRLIISVAAVQAAKVLAQARILEVSAARLGTVGGDTLQMEVLDRKWSWGLTELWDAWSTRRGEAGPEGAS